MNRQKIAVAALGFAITPSFVALYAATVTRWLDRDIVEWARHEAAVEMTRSLFAAVDHFRRDHHRVPTQEEGLAGLTPQYVAAIPLDPWGREFVYRAQGGEWADIVSLGADGQPGGDGVAADISARYSSPGTTTPRWLQPVFFAILLAIPTAAFATARRHPQAAVLLAGTALFWASAVSVTISPGANVSLALVGATAAFAGALVGAVLALRDHPSGTTAALAGTVACQIATAAMMT